MKNRQRIQKSDASVDASVSDDKTQPTHRLTGIAVKEVSVVDRAANKRRYLVVKEDEAKKAQPAVPAVPPAGEPSADALRITTELKTQVMGVLQDAQEKIGVITKVLEGSSETPGAPPPQELMDALTQLATMFLKPNGDAPGGNAPPKEAAKAEGTEGAAPAEKAGKKLSGKRLATLQSARDALAALIDEVSDKPAEGEVKDETTSETPPAAEKSAAKVETPAIDAKLTGIQAEMQQMAASMAESLKKMTEVCEAQNQRIASLTKARGGSAQPDLDLPPKPPEAKVVWDLDMAAPTKTFQ